MLHFQDITRFLQTPGCSVSALASFSSALGRVALNRGWFALLVPFAGEAPVNLMKAFQVSRCFEISVLLSLSDRASMDQLQSARRCSMNQVKSSTKLRYFVITA